MDICILYGQESSQHDLFIEAAEDCFENVMAASLTGVRMMNDADGSGLLYRDRDLTDFDAVFPRFFGDDILFGEQIPEILEHNGVFTPLDPDSFSIATNKFYSVKVLSEGGVSVPQSAYLLSTEETERSAEKLGYPVVMKLISGYGGEGVMRASNPSDLGPFVDTLSLFEQDICLQEFIEHPGEDVRIIVVGDRTYAYKRVIEDGDGWRSNVSQGAVREEYDPPQEVREIAVQAARLAGFDICGVDIIEGDGEYYVIELNMSPGVPEKTQEVVGVDLPAAMMEYVHERSLSLKSEKGL